MYLLMYYSFTCKIVCVQAWRKHSDWNIFKKVTKNIKNNNHKFKALFTLKHLKLVIFQIKLINKWIEICKTNYKKKVHQS